MKVRLNKRTIDEAVYEGPLFGASRVGVTPARPTIHDRHLWSEEDSPITKSGLASDPSSCARSAEPPTGSGSLSAHYGGIVRPGARALASLPP